MYSIMIIFKKEPVVSTYFKNASNFSTCQLAALFEDQMHYYAVVIVQKNTNDRLAKLKFALSEYIIIDDIPLAHGDERVSPDKVECDYLLRVMPIYLIENVREFYTLITPEIAQYFLESNQLFIDHDFISAVSSQLFVFTKKMHDAFPGNDEEGRKKFPEFYARLDKLIKDEIGKAESLALVRILDQFSYTPTVMPHNHSVLFSLPPDTAHQHSTVQTKSATCDEGGYIYDLAVEHDIAEQSKVRPLSFPQ